MRINIWVPHTQENRTNYVTVNGESIGVGYNRPPKIKNDISLEFNFLETAIGETIDIYLLHGSVSNTNMYPVHRMMDNSVYAVITHTVQKAGLQPFTFNDVGTDHTDVSPAVNVRAAGPDPIFSGDAFMFIKYV